MTPPRWAIRRAVQDSVELTALLAAGWEPFAATYEHFTDRKGFAWDEVVYHLRKLVEEEG